jgi:hypothetical protein
MNFSKKTKNKKHIEFSAERLYNTKNRIFRIMEGEIINEKKWFSRRT